MRKVPPRDEYCSRLHGGIADQTIPSARMQMKLQSGTLLVLADAMVIVGKFS